MTAVAEKSIAGAYAAGELGEFFRFGPRDVAAALAQPSPVDRAALSAALRAYHADLGTLNATLDARLARLAHPAARVVVAGQQAGLLTGPAYSVHKGADAVLLARSLDTEELPVLPVYWIASQDHDTAEVASTTLLDLGETLHHLRLDLPQGVPVGRIAWQAEWTRELDRLLERFEAPEAHKARVSALVRGAIIGGPTVTYADVFARLMHALLGEAGLIVLDPLHPALAPLFAPILERELDQPREGPRRIEQAAARLEALGFAPQLRRPEGSSNLFLECDDGQRRLLRWDGRAFQAERRYSPEDLRALLRRDPSRLTPAAGLRPVVQDSVLPTLAFVVGPGEIAYGAQLRGVYDLHGVAQPLLWPRLSVTWLEPPVARLLKRFGLSAREYQRDPEGALGRALARERGAAALTGERLSALREDFNALARDIGALDPTLQGAVRRTQERTLARLERLQAQAGRALVNAELTRSGQEGRLRAHLLPRGVPQEREMNFLTYLLKHGDAPLRRLLSLPPGWSGDQPL